MRIPTSVWLFLVLTLLTCVIAYWADNLGKNLGKKRISLFGLRPRQTATLLSMGSSVAIMLLTLLMLTYLSHDFKNAIFRSDRLNRDNEKLERQTSDLRKRAREFEAQAKTLQSAAEQRRAEAEAATTARNKAQTAAQGAAAKEKQVRGQLLSTQGKLQDAQSSLVGAQNRLNEAQSSLQRAQRNESAARGREEQAQQRFQQANSRYEEAARKVVSAEQQAKSASTQAKGATLQKEAAQRLEAQAKRNYEAARGNLETARAALQAERARLEEARRNVQSAQRATQSAIEENRRVQEQGAQLQRDIAALRQQRNQLESANRQLEDIAAQLGGVASAFVGGDISVPLGQVFAARVIAPNQDASTLRAQLQTLEDEAFAALKEPPIDATSASLIELPDPIRGEGNYIKPDELREILIGHLLEIKEPVEVRWVAARNHSAQEKEIFGRFVPIEIKQVAPAETVLAQEVIDGTQSDARIFNRLLALTDAARIEAREKGVRPPLSPNSPNFFAAGTNDRVFATLREIQSRGGKTRVQIVADKPLMTNEPPRIKFALLQP